MHGPPLVGWLLVVLSAATGLSCLLRHGARDEALMGAGMAVMAVPMSVLDPRPWEPPLLAVVFAAAAVRALRLARRPGHHLHHALGAAAMVYMAAAMGVSAPAGGHAGHVTAGTPLLTGALLVYFAVYILSAGARLMTVTAIAPAGGAPTGPATAPELAACRVSMALGMFAMLLAL
ncbi:DUF5134 domain-containing protein [Streptomyces sp. H10-C2]|uniref:DUF5134 domain-containing protein n=1 Tax=unclassified Streptomyces TaxID=2593676 RepID=UPI0024BA40FD|nr:MULTISPECIES: DUF5134 domain-containing protein [unclassified Streptomyces]MDJ0342939.1 DUF5134 domain-containing protein [Streptomyces sp. PH10-H1]MDJ0371499.1 DUF5134 domain-containing protein [Streptomyces sp. H10-C2]